RRPPSEPPRRVGGADLARGMNPRTAVPDRLKKREKTSANYRERQHSPIETPLATCATTKPVVALCFATVRRTSAPGWPQTRIIEAWSTEHRLQLRGPATLYRKLKQAAMSCRTLTGLL